MTGGQKEPISKIYLRTTREGYRYSTKCTKSVRRGRGGRCRRAIVDSNSDTKQRGLGNTEPFGRQRRLTSSRILRLGEMVGAAGDKRPVSVEPEEGGGAPKRQKCGEGGLVAKPGNGVPKKEQASRNKRDRVKDNEDDVGASKK